MADPRPERPLDGDAATDGRIRLLSPELADQIAAGEVVERPASVVKELVENAIDAGATRVDVELQGGGLESIVVLDDGRGIHPDDLPLAVTRHATSKVRRPSDLVDVRSLGFRGEALASVAAVAHLTIDSRTADASSGTRLRSRPGLPAEREPCGMPRGTRIEVARLFANVPARRKFMRAEATEIGHCSETMLRLGVAHPSVHLRLQHGGRVLLDLPSASLPERIAAVLERRARASLSFVEGEQHGTLVQAWLGPPAAALAHRNGLFVVVRRRVVRERSISQIVTAAYGDALPRQRYPIACVLVEPPPGEVDVNVHPQKSEVRFGDPQAIYTAVRSVLDRWRAAAESEPEPMHAPVVRFGEDARASLDRWGTAALPVGSAAEPRASYRLRTRAASDGYAAQRRELRAEADELQARLREVQGERVSVPAPTEAPACGPSDEPRLELLTCLPGPVAVLRHDDELLAVDLLALRSHLVHRRLVEDLGGEGRVVAQGLLQPVLVPCRPDEVDLLGSSSDALAALGVVLEPFGDDAVMVRAVPAGLRSCVDEVDIGDLVHRVLPWVRVHARKGDAAQPTADEALLALARTGGSAPAPRLARRWIRELLDAGRSLDDVPGIVRYTGRALIGGGA